MKKIWLFGFLAVLVLLAGIAGAALAAPTATWEETPGYWYLPPTGQVITGTLPIDGDGQPYGWWLNDRMYSGVGPFGTTYRDVIFQLVTNGESVLYRVTPHGDRTGGHWVAESKKHQDPKGGPLCCGIPFKTTTRIPGKFVFWTGNYAGIDFKGAYHTFTPDANETDKGIVVLIVEDGEEVSFLADGFSWYPYEGVPATPTATATATPTATPEPTLTQTPTATATATATPTATATAVPAEEFFVYLPLVGR